MQGFISSPDSLLASLPSGNEPGRLIILTGPSGSGKTRLCLALAGRAKDLGILRRGLISPAVFEGDSKYGIDLLDLDTGAQRHLAIHRGDSSSGEITEDWQFDTETINWGNIVLGQVGDCPLFILDELGPLELQRGVGLTGGIGLITSRRFGLACVVVRPSLLEIARVLWPWGEIYDVRSSHPAEVPA